MEIKEKTLRGHNIGTLIAKYLKDDGNEPLQAIYGDDFIKFKNDYFNFLLKNPQIKITVIDSPDTLCNSKNSKGNYLCGPRSKDKCSNIVTHSEDDIYCIKKLGLSVGQNISIQELINASLKYKNKTGNYNPVIDKLRENAEKFFGFKRPWYEQMFMKIRDFIEI